MERYKRNLDSGDIFPDVAQKSAINELQTVYDGLLERWEKPRAAGIWKKLLSPMVRSPKIAIPGIYFWGGVGRGKTYLMDLFFQCLPGQRKMRMHFHRFMQMVHQRLSMVKGEMNPLELVGKGIADEVDVICFDEFFVSDIGDAMILAGLLETLFKRGVTLIATSNIAPCNLYENGLQRDKFMPAITLLERYTKVVNVDSGQDYRLRSLEQAIIYHNPLDDKAEQALFDCFDDLSKGQGTQQQLMLDVLGRNVSARAWSEGLVWFEFEVLCGQGRSALDYIELAQLYHTVLLANIPQLTANIDDKVRRFISLVDEFYDHKVTLIISAAVPLPVLYQGSELSFAFNRTYSRLLEMQTHDYLAQEHKP